MPYFSDAKDDTDTLDILCKKINALAMINKETIESILCCEESEVVSSYEHELECNLSHNDVTKEVDVNSQQFWTLTTNKTVKKVSDRIKSWRYKGDRIEIPSVMREEFDFSLLLNFQDLVQVNEFMTGLAEKYQSVFSDEPEERRAFRTILSNLEYIHVAIGEVHLLTFNVEDSVKKNQESKVTTCMERIVSDFTQIVEKFPKSSLSIRAHGIDTTESLSNNNAIPKLNDADSLSCNTVLLIPDTAILVTKNFEVDNIPYLASGSSDGKLRLWNMTEKRLVKTLYGHRGTITSLEYFELYEKQFLASACENGEIIVWDLRKNEQITTLTDNGYVSALVTYELDKKLILASGSKNSNGINMWNLDNYELIQILKFPAFDRRVGCFALAKFYRQGLPHLITGCKDESIKISNLVDKTLLKILKVFNSGPVVSLCAFEYEGIPILASGNEYIRLWNLEEFTLIKKKSHVGTVTSLGLVRYHDDICLVTSSTNGNLKLWDLDLNARRGLYGNLRSAANSISIFNCCGGVCISSANKDGTIKLWTEP